MKFKVLMGTIALVAASMMVGTAQAEDEAPIYLTSDRMERLGESWKRENHREDRWVDIGKGAFGASAAAACGFAARGNGWYLGAVGATCFLLVPKAVDLGGSVGGNLAELANQSEQDALLDDFTMPPATMGQPVMIIGGGISGGKLPLE